MKLIMENWRKFLTEDIQVENWLWRLTAASKKERLKSFGIRSHTQAMYTGHKYVNDEGQPEGRIYFFKDQESALSVMFMRPEDAAYFIGNLQEGDQMALAMIDSRTLPEEVQYEYDPEISELNAIYAFIPGVEDWKIEKDSIRAVRTADELKPFFMNDNEED